MRTVADGRRKTEAEVRVAIDDGPLLPEDALRHGLVDDLAYEDRLDDLVNDVGGPGRLQLIESDDYADVTWESLGVSRPSKIALLNVVGAITLGRSGFDPINGPVVGSDSIVEYIREIRADSSVKAIVVRVDSPGGASTASDVIWRELMITKNDARKRPIVVSMSDLAASGGYYVAMAGDVLVAQPGTLTGSIGIYTGKFVTGGSFEKAGANVEATSEGRHAEIYSPDRKFTPQERTKVLESMQAFYDQFVEKAAEARQRRRRKSIRSRRAGCGPGSRPVRWGSSINSAASRRRSASPSSGRGFRPKQEVDAGGLPAAPQLLRGAERPVRSAGARSSSTAESILTLLGPRDRRILSAMLAPSRLFRSGEILAHMPYVFLR